MQTLLRFGKKLAGARTWAVAGLVGGFAVAGLSGTASAIFFERYSGVVCQPRYPTATTNFYMVGSTTPGELRNDNTAATAYYACPIPEKTAINQYSISTVEAYVNDQNDNSTVAGSDFQAMARVCSFNTTNGGCGTPCFSEGTGFDTISLSGSDLFEIDHYGMPYLYFSLPRKDVAASSLIGLFFYMNS
jgi:hypothetical protein